jgi:Ca2+:H+ antiporter
LNGDADNISKPAFSKRNTLGKVPEEGSSIGNEKPSIDRESSEEEDEESMKRRHDEMMKRKIPAVQQMKAVLFPQWLTINWLLIAAPVGIGINFTKVNPLAIFLVNFIAIVPLAGILSFATEEIALRVGEVLGGLLNASFG